MVSTTPQAGAAASEPVPRRPSARPAAPGAASPAAPEAAPPASSAPARTEAGTPPSPAPAATREPDRETRYVTIDFDNVEILMFIKFISELTGRNFVVDNAVKGKVTIISPSKITTEEAYKVFESVLEVHGFTTVPAGSIIKVVPSLEARSKDIETRFRTEAVSPEDKVVTQLIPLKYADPEEVKKLFGPFVSKSSIIVSYPPTGMLIITDVLSNIKRLLGIIEAIDVTGIGEEITVIPLQHATASAMEKTLTALFQKKQAAAKKEAVGESAIKIVPDDRTNTLITLASMGDTQKIKQLLTLLDKETPRGEGDIHVYYLQNAKADDLVTVLTAIPSKQAPGEQAGGKAAPAPVKSPVISKDVQITADKATNSLIITAKRDDFVVLEEVIKKLDIPRRMVYIEALIMEVSVNKSFELGVQWQAAENIGHHKDRNIGAFGGSLPSDDLVSKAINSGLSLGVLGESITIGGIEFPSLSAVIRAFQNDSDINILSTPQVMTTDNEEAEIKVADNIPFLTRQERSTTLSEINYSNYEFKDVGVALNITPQINQERFVRLKIAQEVSQVVSQQEIGLPTTLKRTAKTTVMIKDGHTVVIGGLIDESLNKTRYEVPVLSQIPILGWLFRSLTDTASRTNLYIFLTPHIIENPAEAKEVYKEKREQIERIRGGVIRMYGGRDQQEGGDGGPEGPEKRD